MADIYANMGKNLIGTKTFDNLMEAFAGESQARNKYTYFASKARKDGYEQIAKIFEQTAANEKEHEARYRKLIENIEGGLVFSKDGDRVWECGNCGHICIGPKAPDVCPVCDHPQAYFEIHADNY